MSSSSQATTTAVRQPQPSIHSPPTPVENGLDVDLVHITNVLVETKSKEKRLTREIERLEDEKKILEEQVRDLAPLTPLLCSVKRLEALGLHETYFSSMLETWVDVVVRHAESQGIEYLKKLSQDLYALRNQYSLKKCLEVTQ